VKWQILIFHLEQRGSFSLLVTTDLKMLAPLQAKTEGGKQASATRSKRQKQKRNDGKRRLYLDSVLRDMLASLTLEPQHNFLGGFGLIN